MNLDIGIYRRLQRLGVFWLEMASDAKEEYRDCKTCSMIPSNQAKVLNGEDQEEDWQDSYLRYLLEGVLPTDRLKKEKLKRYATRFKVVDGKLFKRSFQEKWLVCISNKEIKGIFSDLHKGSQQDTLLEESYGRWFCTRDTTGLPCKEMPRISLRSVKNVKGKEMRYIPATKAPTQL